MRYHIGTVVLDGAPPASPATAMLPGSPKPAVDAGWIQIIRAVSLQKPGLSPR